MRRKEIGTVRMVATRVVLSAVGILGLLSSATTEEAGAQDPQSESFLSTCGTGVHSDAREGWIWLPQGEIFCSLVADPKASRSFVSYLRGDFTSILGGDAGANTDIGAVGISDRLPLFRAAGSRAGDGIQLEVVGSVFAQFNLDRPSFDLINADYLLGLPLTFRSRGFSARARIYHQSSHLGDEFLLSVAPERENLSFESAELVLSQEVGFLRVYGGGETFFRREPEDLPDHLVHAGLEIRPTVLTNGRLVAAVDVKAVEETDWSPAWSARAGLEIARIPSPGHPPRVLSILVDYYDGLSPYGQFFGDDIDYWGVGLHLSQ